MDIVERLRKCASSNIWSKKKADARYEVMQLGNEAADEIERLQKEIELLNIRIDYYMKVLDMRDALQQKETE